MQQDVNKKSQQAQWEEHLSAITKAHLLTDEDGLISGTESMKKEWEAFKILLSKVYGKLRGLCGGSEEETGDKETGSEGGTERESEEADRT